MKNKSNRKTIAFFINQFNGSYQSVIWPLVFDACRKRDINVLFFPGKPLCYPYNFETQYNIIYSLANEYSVDGIISNAVLSVFVELKQYSSFLSRFKKIPLVNMVSEVPGIPSVVINESIGIQKVVHHLVKQHGAKKIAFVKGPEKFQEADNRFSAYKQALKENNIDFDPSLVAPGNFVFDTGFRAAEELLKKRKVKPDAIMAANDEMLLGIMAALDKMNYHIPHDIKVAGFDDIEEIKFTHPPATTVRQPFKKEAETAVDLLFELMEGRNVPEIVTLPTELVVRQSCGCFDVVLNSVSLEINLNQPPEEIQGDIQNGSDPAIFSEIFEKIQDLLIENQAHTALISRLINKLKQDINSSSENSLFLQGLEETLKQDVMEGVDISFWQKALIIIRKLIIPYFKDIQPLNKVEDILHKAQVLFGTIQYRVQYNTLKKRETQELLLHSISQSIISTLDIRELIKVLTAQFDRLGIERFILCLYEGDTGWDGKLKWEFPPASKILLDYRGGVRIKHSKSIIPTRKIIPDGFFNSDAQMSAAVMPLFLRKEHFGYIVLSMIKNNDIIYEELRSQISGAVKGALLLENKNAISEELKKTLQALENSYKKLEQLSVLDELTGLYNRRGFMTLARQHLELSRRKPREFLFFFIDIDGLKAINDTYGHKEGDSIILETAKIFYKTFRQTDIIGRWGGDEFTILAIDSTMQESEKIKNRMLELITSYNETSGKPYELAFSIGSAPYVPGKHYAIEELIEEADSKLYQEKKAKKEKE
jgi:diguanylate cyclase (GGDEF)-like protein